MIKVLKLNNRNSLKSLKSFLDKRKYIQRNKTSTIINIIRDVKKYGDKAVLKYEKKFSRIKTKSNKILLSNKEINQISKKTELKIKKSIDLAFKRIKKFHSNKKFLFHLKINIKICSLTNIVRLKRSASMFLEAPQVIQVLY